ncbi:MAG: hypothetical protein VYE40_18210 [Myxococcota bacterium]|jgi:hypothetical protein|nr:hypothetical protein [Myxococcota bacterium]MEC9443034.1 hypothetical protein [Myxococcota bacterium]
MAQNIKETLAKLEELDGFIAAAIGHAESGMAMGTLGGSDEFDPEIAAAVNSDVIKAKLRGMDALMLSGRLEDVLITLDSQYHLIRLYKKNPMVFIYLALSRKNANLAMARFKLETAEASLEL